MVCVELYGDIYTAPRHLAPVHTELLAIALALAIQKKWVEYLLLVIHR